MKSTFTTLNAKIIFALIYLSTLGVIQAQNFTGQWGKTNGPCIAPQSLCLNPDNITWTGITNTATTAAATSVCNPLNEWTTIDYTFTNTSNVPTPQDLSGNNLLVTLSSNVSGKFVLIQLQDNTGKQTGYNLNYVLAIPQANTNYQYSVDFHPVMGTCSLTVISKIRVMIFNAQTAGGNDATTNFTGNFTITYSSDNKKTNEVDLVPSSVNQVWVQEANNLIYNPRSSGVLLGALPSQVDPGFLFPYYSATIKGRTNILGNDNAFEIWSNNLINGRRQYVGIGNYAFTDNSEYSLINSGEYGTGGYYSKSLIIQNNSGNVGIGTFTSAPSEKLTVNGNIKCKKFIVTQLNWADYVFKTNYNLMPLSSVKKFVVENKHLPNVPSEEELKEKGMEVGEMMKLQMEKIEELTLYIIQQQEQIDLLKKQLESINSKGQNK